MIHIADESLIAGDQDVLLNVILICFQSLILMIQEITVQDRALTPIGKSRKQNPKIKKIEKSLIPKKIHMNALDSNGKSAARVHSMLLMKILVRLLKNGLKLIPNQFELNSVNHF